MQCKKCECQSFGKISVVLSKTPEYIRPIMNWVDMSVTEMKGRRPDRQLRICNYQAV